jgi:transcriptional regulator with XRE-family HTH domain
MMTLSEYMKQKQITQVQLAARLGVHQGTIARLVSGDRSPSWELAAKIERATAGHVPVAVWAQREGGAA